MKSTYAYQKFVKTTGLILAGGGLDCANEYILSADSDLIPFFGYGLCFVGSVNPIL